MCLRGLGILDTRGTRQRFTLLAAEWRETPGPSAPRMIDMEPIWIEHYEAGVPPRLDLEQKTVVDYLDASAAKWGSRPALTLKGKDLTYAQLKDQVDRFATALAGLGVTRNSRVALWLPTLPQTVIAYYATLRLGAQVVNTNPLYVERELEHQFSDAGVSVVITLDYLWWTRLRKILGKTGVRHVIVTSLADYLPFPMKLAAPRKLKKTGQYVKVPREENVHFFKELVASHPPSPPAVDLSLEHVALLQYTGGTTGVSKAAMLTHRNLSANAQQCRAWFPIAEPGGEVVLVCLPLFHVFGMTVSMLWPISIGARLVLMPNPRNIKDLVQSIPRYHVTLLSALPALFVAINGRPGIDRVDVSSIKACFSGSAPLPAEVLWRFEELTGGKITEAYGLTETSPVTHANPLNGVRKIGSVGVPVPETDMKIVDVETGRTELPVGEEGELCIRGPQVMAGYWNRPDETANTLRDGWVYTGDLARVDEQGYTYIVGRKKDMIVASGYNIYPDEVDGVLFTHPAVLDAATIGVPDPRRGEAVKSFIVLEPGGSATKDEIIRHCREQLAAYKVPRSVEFIPELPKNAMMKTLRRELRDRELARLRGHPGRC
jgi:long-chain acyl-CoA synthetase